jgi:predicted MPP superfamily phosphohydrolase
LKRDAPRVRILHLGDIHIERMTGREERLIQMVQDIKPDLILYSGDFLNLSFVHDENAHQDCDALWSRLSAPLGVFVVSGSPGVDDPLLLQHLLPSLNVHWLRDQRVTIDKAGQQIDVIGINCTHRPFEDGPRLKHVVDGGVERFTILLYHTPDLAPEAANLGIDLQLSGHTHGGQVRLPFYGAIFTSSLYGKKFEVGLRRVRDMILYVTRGIGMEGKAAPRVRFLCPPEIIVWEIGPDGQD